MAEKKTESYPQTSVLRQRYTDKDASITWMNVGDIDFSWWNPNVMPAEEEKALLEDMRQYGPYGIDPIKVVSRRQLTGDTKPDRLVCVDGNHRLKHAITLGWEKIRVIEDPSIRDEVTARVYSYQVNFERGHMDPFREAENFRWLMEKNRFTQEELAKELHIDRTTVARRLSLLKIPEEVKKQVATVAPKLTTSHFEEIASAAPEVQKKVVKEALSQARRGRELTVSDIRDEVKATTRIEEAKAKLKAALDDPKSQFKKCPACGQAPDAIDHNGLPWVRCQNYDSAWNLQTGKTQRQLAMEEAAKARKERASKAGKKATRLIPNYVLSTHTRDEFVACALNLFHEVIPRLAWVEHIRIFGETKNPKAEFEFEVDDDFGTRVDVDVPGHRISLHIEDKEYKVASLKQFKSLVRTGGVIRTEEQHKQAEKLVADFFQRYAPKELLDREKEKEQQKEKASKEAAKEFIKKNAPKKKSAAR